MKKKQVVEQQAKTSEPKPEINQEVVALLTNHKLFVGVSEKAISKIIRGCPLIYLDEGQLLLSPGEINHHLYLLLSGQLNVCFDVVDSAASIPINPGEYIGEMSIIEERETSAFVVAQAPSRLVAIHEDQFWQKAAKYPEVMRNMLQMFSQRMRKQNQMTRRSLEQQLYLEHLQHELEAAGKIQANILPQEFPLFPDHPEVDVCAIMEPAKEVGGDFYDAFALDDDHVCVAVGDVSGKGLPAAMFMVRSITLLRMTLSKKKKFSSMMDKINQMLCENNKDFTFLTLFVAMLNVRTGELEIVNGGHNPPFVSFGGEPFRLLPMPKGALLGVSPSITFETKLVQMQPGDALVLYTDGVTESEDRQQQQFSAARAVQALNTAVPPHTPATLIKQLHDAVLDFAQDAPQSDDMTILALTYLGESTP